MKIFLSGPISWDDDCVIEFADAEKELHKKGHIVINPVYLPKYLGLCETYAHICFPMIDVCDAVVMLNGWEDSNIACMQYGYAVGMDKIVVDYRTMICDEERKDT